VSPCVPVALDPLLVPESFGTTTCPVVSGMPPNREGLWCHNVSHGSRHTPGAGGLWHRHVPPGLPPGRDWLRCHHVTHGSRPAS
jgi:hypothetical protein